MSRRATAHPASFKKLDKHGEVKASAFGSFYIRANGVNVTAFTNGSEVTGMSRDCVIISRVVSYGIAKVVQLG